MADPPIHSWFPLVADALVRRRRLRMRQLDALLAAVEDFNLRCGSGAPLDAAVWTLVERVEPGLPRQCRDGTVLHARVLALQEPYSAPDDWDLVAADLEAADTEFAGTAWRRRLAPGGLNHPLT